MSSFNASQKYLDIIVTNAGGTSSRRLDVYAYKFDSRLRNSVGLQVINNDEVQHPAITNRNF